MKNSFQHSIDLHPVSIGAKALRFSTPLSMALVALIVKMAVPHSSSAGDSDGATVNEMLEMRPEARARIDLMEATLACAAGLTGSENVNSDHIMENLREWTEAARVETERTLKERQVRLSQFRISEARSKAEALVRTMQNVLRVEYQLSKPPADSFQAAGDLARWMDSGNVFVTGILGGSRKGTCFSMPFLYLALGRRLNYPLKLASDGNHLWLRWEGEEHFYIDWQESNLSLKFREEASKVPPFEVPHRDADDRLPASTRLLNSDDELSLLLSARGACWESHGRINDALVAYAQAHKLSPDCMNHTQAIARLMPTITPLFGHTAPMLAPDYSQRRDLGMELTKSGEEWDEAEREYFGRMPPPKTVAEQNEGLRQRNDFQQRRVKAQNEIMTREEVERSQASPVTHPDRPRP